jgi:hypothetical protein
MQYWDGGAGGYTAIRIPTATAILRKFKKEEPAAYAQRKDEFVGKSATDEKLAEWAESKVENRDLLLSLYIEDNYPQQARGSNTYVAEADSEHLSAWLGDINIVDKLYGLGAGVIEGRYHYGEDNPYRRCIFVPDWETNDFLAEALASCIFESFDQIIETVRESTRRINLTKE